MANTWLGRARRRRAVGVAAVVLGTVFGAVASPFDAAGRTNGPAEQAARRILDARERVDDTALAILINTARLDRFGTGIADAERALADMTGSGTSPRMLRQPSPDGFARGLLPTGSPGPSLSIGAEQVHGELSRVVRRELQVMRRGAEVARREIVVLRAMLGQALVHLAEVEQHRLPDAAVEREVARQGHERRLQVVVARATRTRASEIGAGQAAVAGAAIDSPASAAQDPDAVDGSLSCPVEGPVEFVDTWGASRSGGRRHRGVDMMAAHGTPVVAVESGNARFTTSRLGGRTIWLSGDSGTSYFYAHLSSWEGMSRPVAHGEVIGYVGTTGNAFVDHLHFEVHPNDDHAVRPYPYVSGAC